MVPLLGLCGAVAPLSCSSISLARATPRRLCVPSIRLMGVVHTLSVYCAPSNLDCCFAAVCPGVATSRLPFCWEQIGIITISITPSPHIPTHILTHTYTMHTPPLHLPLPLAAGVQEPWEDGDGDTFAHERRLLAEYERSAGKDVDTDKDGVAGPALVVGRLLCHAPLVSDTFPSPSSFLSLSVPLPFCHSVVLSLCLSVSLCVSASLSISLSVSPTMHLSIFLVAKMSICLSMSDGWHIICSTDRGL